MTTAFVELRGSVLFFILVSDARFIFSPKGWHSYFQFYAKIPIVSSTALPF